MAKTQKYYVVWQGRETGIMPTWARCQAAVHGYAGARYQAFRTREQAEAAFCGEGNHLGTDTACVPAAIPPALCVDAAANMVTFVMEYRGVLYPQHTEVFRVGPIKGATNNIGEFLAIIDGLQFLQQRASCLPLYTDSTTAMAWVRNKQANSAFAKAGKASADANARIAAATEYLKATTITTDIRKWPTAVLGDIPADFGRK